MSSNSSNLHHLEFPGTNASVQTLGNGLEVIIREDHSAPVVSLQAWCRAGSIHEGNWLGAGMSHFLEHMLFKGTERRSASEVAREVQSCGGYVNAYTSFDRTVYWIDAPSPGFEDCLDVLCDVVGFARIPADEFEKEQEVIRREFAMGDDNPGQVINKRLFHNAYTVHPCRHPVIGHLDLFNQLGRDDLYRYYQEKYSPDNLFLVIVGDVDSARALELVDSHLGGISRRRHAMPNLPEEPAQIGRREDIVEFPTELSRSRISWQIPDETHPDVPALDLLGSILGGGRSSRLYHTVREEKQLAHGVSAYAYTPSCRGMFVLSVDAEPGHLAAAEKAALEVIDTLKREGATGEELERVRNQSLSAQFSTLTDMRGQASDLGSNWHATRNLDYTRDYVREIQNVTVEEVRDVANRYFDHDRTTRVALIPQGSGPTSTGTSGATRSEDIRKIVLDNGLTLLLLADQRVPFVQGNASFRGGRLAEDEVNAGITKLMGRLLTKDTSTRTARQVAHEIETAGGGISAMVGNNTFGTSAGALKTDLSLVVDILSGSIQDALFTEEGVAREKKFQLSAIRSDTDQPTTVALNQLRSELFGQHPYGLPDKGTETSLESIGREQLIQFRDGLIQGGNGVIGVFGDLDFNEVEDLLRARFESIPQGPRLFVDRSGSGLPDTLGKTVELYHEKEQAILLIGYRTCDLTSEDNVPLGLIDEACSDMASRMFIRIREELGLAYSVGCTRMLGLDSGYITFYAATSPEKLDLVEGEMLDEISKLSREGLESDEFDRAKASWLGREVIHLQGARELAGVATVDELVGLGWDHYRQTPGEIAALTEERIREVAANYLRDRNQVIVTLTTQ